MGDVPFTHYLRPDGRRREVLVDRPAEISAQADAIIAVGFRFECEELMDGTVSLTIAGDEDDVEIELCPNGPAVLAAVDRMISRFAAHLAKQQVAA